MAKKGAMEIAPFFAKIHLRCFSQQIDGRLCASRFFDLNLNMESLKTPFAAQERLRQRQLYLPQ